MSIQNRKITEFTKPVSAMPDSPSEAGMTAQDIKENFDSNSNQLKDALNGLIDDLTPSIEGTDAVFHAAYGETTCAEMEKAFQDGKSIICSDEGGAHWSAAGVRISPTVFIFSLFDDSSLFPRGSGTQITVLQNSGDIWSSRVFVLPSSDNVQARIENAIEGAKEVFRCYYGETTSDEINSAYLSGRVCVLVRYGVSYLLTGTYSSTNHIFSALVGSRVYFVQCEDDEWSAWDSEIVYTNSPELTGIPTAPTAPAGTNTQQIATTAFVKNAVGGYMEKAAGAVRGNLVEFNANGGAADSGKKAADFALASALEGKQDKLTFDSAPIQNSLNPVTSGGVYAAIKEGGGGESNVFIAEYGVSTSALVRAAYDAGKVPVCRYGSMYLTEFIRTGEASPYRYTFFGIKDGGGYPIAVKAELYSGQWTAEEILVSTRGYVQDSIQAAEDALQWEIAAKQDLLTFDSTPTEGSANPVTSGGVYAALADAGEDSLFIAVYNQTAGQDIYSAFTDYGRIPVLKMGRVTYCGYMGSATTQNFFTVRGTAAAPQFERKTCSADGTWSQESAPLATTEFVQNAVSGMHNMSTDGDWTIRKQSDGFFEAWYTKTETTANIHNANGALYESDKLTIALPAGISPVDFSKLHVQLNVSETQFAAWSNIYSVSASGIEYSVMSTTSRGIQSHYRVGIYIAGYTS